MGSLSTESNETQLRRRGDARADHEASRAVFPYPVGPLTAVTLPPGAASSSSSRRGRRTGVRGGTGVASLTFTRGNASVPTALLYPDKRETLVEGPPVMASRWRSHVRRSRRGPATPARARGASWRTAGRPGRRSGGWLPRPPVVGVRHGDDDPDADA